MNVKERKGGSKTAPERKYREGKIEKGQCDGMKEQQIKE